MALTLLLMLGLLSAWSVSNLTDSSRRLNHTQKVLEKLESLVGKINEMESRVRGYVLTHQSTFLESYHRNTQEIQALSQEIQTLTSDNPLQQRYFQKLAPLVRTRMAWSADLHQTYLKEGLAASLPKLERNNQLSEQIRKLVKSMKIEEQDRVKARQQGMEQTALTTLILVGVGTFFALGLILRSLALNRNAYQQLLQANQAADAANQTKSLFLANMGHELRTPLNAVIGYSEMLAEDAAEMQWSTGQADLLKIGQAGQELLALINQILDFSQLETGQMDVWPEIFDLRQLLEALPPLLQPLMRQNQNQLSLNLAPNLGKMYSDQAKVRQVVFSLLSNACKFTQAGQIELRAYAQDAQRGEQICIEVKDTGIGIAPDYVKQLFLDFSQADLSASRKYGGTGLGLALTKRYCELLKGQIEVSSEQGQGSVFKLSLARSLSNV
ncbi:MAG: CHASE3 domain-containing protein [Candidatus Sericytochromatia bacterium]